MKCLLSRYEDNGYHDSYFYAVIWDSVKKTISDVMEGSTAFYGGNSTVDAVPLYACPDKVKASFRAWACRRSAELILEAELSDINEPKSVSIGDKLITTRNVCRKKEAVIEKGTSGEVFWSGTFGTFYRNGYNHPNRYNIRVGLKLENGDKVFVALNACGRDKKPESLVSIHRTMKRRYDNCEFSTMGLSNCRGWYSDEYFIAPDKMAA